MDTQSPMRDVDLQKSPKEVHSHSQPKRKHTEKIQAILSESKKAKVSDPLLVDERYLNELNRLHQRGRIELIMGPMFAGKSTELLRRVKRHEITGKKCLFIKFACDNRYDKESISTHDK